MPLFECSLLPTQPVGLLVLCVQALSAAGEDLVGVVVALGGKTKEVGPSMLTDGTTNIINGMKRLAPKAKVRPQHKHNRQTRQMRLTHTFTCLAIEDRGGDVDRRGRQ